VTLLTHYVLFAICRPPDLVAIVEDPGMKNACLAIGICCLVVSLIRAQAPKESPGPSTLRTIQARAVVGACTVPYCLDLAWQIPLGSRLSWVTTSVANPEKSPARVFLLRGTGTVLTPGFGTLCTKLRSAGIWSEDLGDAGERWISRELIEERRTGATPGPIVLVGHSRGGRNAIDAARSLQHAGIAVDLLVCLDTALPPTVPGNVRDALNIYWSEPRLYPAAALKADSGARTQIENIDLSDPHAPLQGQGLHHLNVTASPAVQDFVIGRILALAGKMNLASRTP
jgi:hypothetical protein